MKKKSGKGKVDSDINFKDLDGMDDDLDFGELEDVDEGRKTSKTGVAKELLKEAGTGFLSSAIKKTTEKALPEEYSSNYYEAMEYADFAKETFDTNKSKVNKSLFKLGKEVKKILPFQSKMLDGFLSKYETDFEQFKSQTEEQVRDAGIQSNIGSIFDKQLEIQKAFESKRSAEEQVDKKQQLGINKINLDVLTNIDSNIGNQTAFTLQISKEYYKKSLELQFKSYYIQADMLKTMRDYYKGFSIQFEGIVKNTGLPDFVKLNNTERISEVIRTQAIQNTYKKVFDNNEYIKNIKQKFSNLVSEKVTNVTDKIDSATDIIGGVNQAGEMGGGPGKLIAGIMAGMGGSTLGEKLADKISPKIKDKLKDNKAINTGGNYLQMLANSPSTLFGSLKNKANKKAEEYSDESSPLRFLASKLFGGAGEMLGVADGGTKKFEVKNKSILTHDKPAIFDNKVHRSITEVIPMYLAKILNENTNLRSMYKLVNNNKLKSHKDSEEKIYDFENRKLSTAAEFKASIQASVFKDNNKQSKKLTDASSSITSLASDALGKDGANKDDVKLLKNKKMQTLFDSYISKASEKITDKDFTYDSIVTNYTDNSDLVGLIDKDPNAKELRKYLEVLKKAKLAVNNPTLNDKILDTRRVYPILPVKELFKSVSKLASSKTLNNIKDELANVISKALYEFITHSNNDIMIDNIVNAKCFSFVSNIEIKENIGFIKRFIAEVKTIKDTEDIVRESSLEVLLGIVNRSLKDSAEIDPEVFQTLYNYSPLLQETGELTKENIVEGKLGKFMNENIADPDVVKDLSRVRARDVRSLATQQSKSSIIEQIENSTMGREMGKISNTISKLKENISKADNAKDIFGAAKSSFTDIAKQVKESGKTLYVEAEKLTSELTDKLEAIVNDVSDQAAKKTYTFTLDTTNKIIDKINNLITKEKENKEESIRKMNEVTSIFSENVNEQNLVDKLNREANVTFVKARDIEIKALEKFKRKLIDFNSAVKMNPPADGVNVKEYILNLKSKFSNLVKEWEQIKSQVDSEMEAEAAAIS